MNVGKTTWSDSPWQEVTPLKPYTPRQPKTEVEKKIDICIVRGHYDDAISVARAEIRKARDETEKNRWTKQLGHILTNASRFDEAIAIFQSIPNWQKTPNILQAVAITLSTQGKHSEAITLLDNNWQDDDGFLCCKARVYHRLNQHEKAIELFSQCRCLYKDDASTFGLARSHEALGRYAEAVAIYLKAKHYNTAKALENLGRCYANMKEHEKAKEAFEELVRRWPEAHYFLPFGRFYQDVGQYDKAIDTFKRYPNWRTNAKLKFAIACCEEAANDPNKSRQTFQKVDKWQQNNNVILALGRTYEREGKYVKAEATFKRVLDWQKSPETLLCLARTTQLRLEKLGDLRERHLEVAEYFTMLPDWNNSVKALRGLAWLYLHAELYNRARYYIDVALVRFPDVVEFYQLMALYMSKCFNYEEGIPFLVSATNRFPHDAKLAIMLFEFYVKAGKKEDVRLLYDKYSKQFAGNSEFLQETNKWFKTLKTAPQKAVDRITHVTLPDEIKAVFSTIGNERVYLVGSSVIHLILGDYSTQTAHDLDFSTRFKELGPALVKQGFAAIEFVPGLYRRWAQGATPEIDLMLSELKLEDEAEPWINVDVPRRDFTICALYCDHTGKVFDPTGRGIQDVKNRILATVVSAELCFQHDPVCILRGLKYITRGYTPTDEVVLALKNWKPTEQIKPFVPHIAAVLRKLIRTNRNFVQLLTKYNLKDKFKSLFTDPVYGRLVESLDKKLNFRAVVVRPRIQYTDNTFVPSK